MKLGRRALALLFCALLFAPSARAAEDGAPFTDVPASHWAYESVRRAAALGLVQGMGDGTFGLGGQVTRAQYAAMLCRLMGWTLTRPETGSFADNADPLAWYYPYIETVRARGLLPAAGGTCGPEEPLGREEMAVLTVRALDVGLLAGLVQDECPFTDTATNRGYLTLAWRMGVIRGVDRYTFAPAEACTREQAAAVLLRVYDRLHAPLTVGAADEAPARAVAAQSLTGTEALLPVSPRAGLEQVYAAAAQAGEGGAVVLRLRPLAQRASADGGCSAEELTDEAFAALRDSPTSAAYRSARYASSYLVCAEGGGIAVVWYESEEDLACKLTLCRLLGVAGVYLER